MWRPLQECSDRQLKSVTDAELAMAARKKCVGWGDSGNMIGQYGQPRWLWQYDWAIWATEVTLATKHLTSHYTCHSLAAPGNVKSHPHMFRLSQGTQIHFSQSESWRLGVGWDLNGLFRFWREDMEDIKPNCGSNVQAGLQMAADDVALYPSVLVRDRFKFFSLLELDPSRSC